MGLVSGWSLANHSNSESFLVVPHHSAKMDASERDSGTWTDAVSSFDLSQTLPVGGGLLSSLVLIRTSHVKQIMQMVTMVPGQDGRFQSLCFP